MDGIPKMRGWLEDERRWLDDTEDDETIVRVVVVDSALGRTAVVLKAAICRQSRSFVATLIAIMEARAIIISFRIRSLSDRYR